ncbi:hypothetical protein [Streptomyces sp. NPDC051567]|uniref:hypothetical protein n=1 Tax=Streptomyces sp. NPDC051567 TaxID=3365660 RepID=UPI0037B017FA
MHRHTARRASSGLAALVACFLLMCGFLMGAAGTGHATSMADAAPMTPMTMTGTTMTGATRADTGVTDTAGTGAAHPPAEHRSGAPARTAPTATGDGGCPARGEECPLASAQAPAPLAWAVPPAPPPSAVTALHGQPPAERAPGCARPRAPDLRSLCVSRT